MIGIALAVGFGVQMGESTIASINPIHFQGAAPPVIAVDPNASPAPQNIYAQAYGWEQGLAARQADGGAFATPAAYQDFDYVPQVAVRRGSEPSWQEASAPVNLTPWPPGQISSHPEVERYTDYPVEEKPVAAARPHVEAPERVAPQAATPQPAAAALSPMTAPSLASSDKTIPGQ